MNCTCLIGKTYITDVSVLDLMVLQQGQLSGEQLQGMCTEAGPNAFTRS